LAERTLAIPAKSAAMRSGAHPESSAMSILMFTPN